MTTDTADPYAAQAHARAQAASVAEAMPILPASAAKGLPPGVDACGENGEFHTFVYDGPAFSAPVALRRTQVLQYDAPANLGGATYYFQELAPA